MTLHLWLTNLAAYSAQIAALIAVGSAAAYLLRVRRPGAMLIYRQAILAACLLLPLLQPWRRPVVESSSEVSISAGETHALNAPSRRLSLEQMLALALGAGVLARLLWLGIGLRRLRRYRHGAEPLAPLPATFEDLQLGLPTRVAIGLSTEVASPVAFGVRHPMVLLPAQFLDMPEGLQRAIACHEMAHIRRGDWAVTMIEEVIRALFWFHPCVWWLLGQIQLTREQVVDCEVIDVTNSRDQYVDALMAVAGVRLHPDLAPAPLFLRKSHLTQRVALILKGVSMSKPRLLSSLAAMCGALIFTTRLAVLYFPMNAPAQEVVRGDVNLLHRSPLEYPADAIEHGIQGTVILEATLNQRGVVVDARVISGPEALRKAALKSVLEWHYTGQAVSPVEIAIDFKLPAKTPGASGGVPGGVPGSVAPAPAPAAETGRLLRIQITGVSSQLREALGGRLPIREGDEIQPDTLSRVGQAVRDLDEHLAVRLNRVRRTDGGTDFVLQIFSNAPMETPVTSVGPQRIRIGGNVQAAMAISAPRPVYPPQAKQARIQGTVRLNVVINKDGTVQDIQVASGHPLLVESALEAVRGWVYKPTLLNGEPVEVITVVDVNYTLSE